MEFNHSFQISFRKNNNAVFFVLFIEVVSITHKLRVEFLFVSPPTFSVKYLGNNMHKTDLVKLSSICQEVSQWFWVLFEEKNKTRI